MKTEHTGPTELAPPPDTPGKVLWVKPTIRQSVLDYGTTSGVSRHPSDQPECSPVIAVENARAMLGNRAGLTSAIEWGDLIGTLAAKRSGEARSDGQPDPTRFNDRDRASKGKKRVQAAFEAAAEADATEGAVLTLTTAMEQSRIRDRTVSGFANLAAAADEWRGDLGDLNAIRRWLNRPPAIPVYEPTTKGVPHVHLTVFPADPDTIPTTRDLEQYLETRDRALIGYVDRIRFDANRGDGWHLVDPTPGRFGSRSPCAYLSKGPRHIAAAAKLKPSDIHAIASAHRALENTELSAETAGKIDATIRETTNVDTDPAAIRNTAWFFATGLPSTPRLGKLAAD